MLPQKYRLRKREDFARVFRFGKTFTVDGMRVFIFNTPSTPSKIGIAFKQKMFPKASRRNWYKRRVLSAIFPLIETFSDNKFVVLLFQKPEQQPTPAYFTSLAMAISRQLKTF